MGNGDEVRRISVSASDVVAASIRDSIDGMDRRVSALTKAAKATLMFHTTGSLIPLHVLQEWNELTGARPMTAQGLVDFVRAKIEEAKS